MPTWPLKEIQFYSVKFKYYVDIYLNIFCLTVEYKIKYNIFFMFFMKML